MSNRTDRSGRSAEELRAAAKLRGRLLRRRRAGLWSAGVATTAVVVGVVVAMVAAPGGHRRTLVVGGGLTVPALPSACQAGAPPKPGVPRVGAGVRFTTLPAGFASTGTSDYNGTTDEGATPDGVSDTTRHIQAVLEFGVTTPKPEGVDTRAGTVQGHPATIISPANDGPASTIVEWSPAPDARITVTGTELPASTVIAAAQGVAYEPGTAAGAVGDLGPTIPRSEAVAIAAAQPSPTTRTVTWLTDGAEFTQAQTTYGGVSGGDPSSGNYRPDTPLWVVAQIGTFPTHGETPYNAGPGSATGHVNITVINAVTGKAFETTQSAVATIPAEFASLPDHAGNGPCPSPSSTQPSVQPSPAVAAPPPLTIGVPATVTSVGASGDSPALNLDIGTNQGLVGEDTAYVAGPSLTLVGKTVQWDKTWSQVQLYTDAGTAYTVRIDPAGDEAVAVGNGPGRRLNLYMVNRNAHPHIGDTVTTAGPADTGTPGGLTLGTIATITPGANGQSPTVTVTPALSSTPHRVNVIPDAG